MIQDNRPGRDRLQIRSARCRLTTACSRRPSQSSNLHAQICRLSGARLMLAVRRHMPTKSIDRLLFAQGGLCFFCQRTLSPAEASVEHLVATANGGRNDPDNTVACCKALNALLGHMSLKEKLRVVLNQKGEFRCPNGRRYRGLQGHASPNCRATPRAGGGQSSEARHGAASYGQDPKQHHQCHVPEGARRNRRLPLCLASCRLRVSFQ